MPTLEIVEVTEVLCGACFRMVTIATDEYYVECDCGDILIDNRPEW